MRRKLHVLYEMEIADIVAYLNSLQKIELTFVE